MAMIASLWGHQNFMSCQYSCTGRPLTSGLLAVTRTFGQTVGISVLGAVWSARAVMHNGGVIIPGGPSNAEIAVQVPAMQDTLHVSAGLVSVALILALWALYTERRSRGQRVKEGVQAVD